MERPMAIEGRPIPRPRITLMRQNRLGQMESPSNGPPTMSPSLVATSSGDSSRSTPDSIRIHLYDMTSTESSDEEDNSRRRGWVGEDERNDRDVSTFRPSGISKQQTSPVPPPQITMLERIVRSHPIWYLQEVGRAQAEDYLRDTPPGTFIVRGCSRAHAMALSVKQRGTEVEHLLLIHAAPSGVKLHLSVNVFKSLPLLVQHYSMHTEELRVPLALPHQIAVCQSTSLLQGWALMGQDFWTSSAPSMDEIRRDRPNPVMDAAPTQRKTETMSPKGLFKTLLSDSRHGLASNLAHCSFFLPFRSRPTSSRSSMNMSEWNADRHGFRPSVSDCSTIGRRMALHADAPAAALRPPPNAFDYQNTRNCVEELRRKRLQSAEELLGMAENGGCPQLRPKKTLSSSTRSHRLSAPLVADAAPPSVLQTARALRERIPRNVDGELAAINEGLVTPVVRRKHPESPKREARDCLSPIQHIPQQQQISPSLRPAHRSPQQDAWQAVSTELRSRQQRVIAKVRPTPQNPPSSMLISERGNAREGPSEYAQLSECVDVVNSVREDDTVSIAPTVFDEPWDSNTWEHLLVCVGEGRADDTIEEESDDEKGLSPTITSRTTSHHSLLSLDIGFTNSLKRPAKSDRAASDIQRCVISLSSAGGTFAKSLEGFVMCTKESTERNPRVVAKNIRQFMDGMKNYLVKQGEGDLHYIINRETTRLDINHFLNIDVILEHALNRLILKELYDHLYSVIRTYQRTNGSLLTLFSNIEKAKQLNLSQLGLPLSAIVPSTERFERIRILMKKMQMHYSPHRKLEFLLKAVRMILNKGEAENSDPAQNKYTPPPTDDLLRWLIWLISRTLSVSSEGEALYMTELLPTQIRASGHAAFYLSSFDSAIRILSSPDGLSRLSSADVRVPPPLIRVAVPDESLGCMHYDHFPAVAQMTVAKLCRLVAHQHNITNPEDYGLYILADGYENALGANEAIDDITDQVRGKPHLLAYKRHDARIAWPRLPR